MTKPYYDHPGEVREAMNFQCLHCPKILQTPQGLCGHLSRLHGIEAKDIQYKRDWEITDQLADDNVPSPAINRDVLTSSYSGDRKMKSRKERTSNLECIMPGCVAVYSSSPGMSGHQKRQHQQGSKININWRWSMKPVTVNNLRSRAAQERKGIRPATATAERHIDRPSPKRKYARRQPVVLTPDSKTIEIAAVIRVPISVGQAEILQEGELLT